MKKTKPQPERWMYPSIGTIEDAHENGQRCLTLGHALSHFLIRLPQEQLSQDVLRWLDVYLEDPHTRALFNLSPELNETTLAFKNAYAGIAGDN